MKTKWCLLKSSDGQRGANGKKKVYEVRIDGFTVICEWGMAEKGQRRSSVTKFYSEQGAMRFATEKVASKIYKGYEVAYSV